MKYLFIGITVAALVMVSCVTPPEVVQGTVTSFDEAGKILVIQEQGKPDSSLRFLFDGAEIGANPVPGDTIRVAYRTQDGKLQATRIMNISRQKDLSTGK
jgi:hypothetical protein